MAKRLIKIAKELNVGTSTLVEHLNKSGFDIDNKPTAKITEDMETELLKEFQKSLAIKEKADQLKIGRTPQKKEVEPMPKIKEPVKSSPPPEPIQAKVTPPGDKQQQENGRVQEQETEVLVEERSKPKLTVLGKINLDPKKRKEEIAKKATTPDEQPPKKEEKVEAKVEKPAEQEQPKPEKKEEKAKQEEATTPPPSSKSEDKPSEKEEVKQPKAETKQAETDKKEEVQPKAEQPKDKPKSQPKEEVEAKEKPKEKEASTEPVAEKKKEAPEQTTTPKAETQEAKTPVKENAEVEEVPSKKKSQDVVRAEAPELRGLKIKGKIDIGKFDRNRKKKKKEPVKKEADNKKKTTTDKPTSDRPKRPRKRKKVSRSGTGGGSSQDNNRQRSSNNRGSGSGSGGNRRGSRRDEPKEVSQKEIEEKIKATMARMSGGGKKKRQRIRRENRERTREKQEQIQQEKETGKLQLTEFISVSELASLMNVSVTDVITTCMNLGVIVSINQRLDAEIIELVAEEFGHEIEFISAEDHTEEEEDIEDDPEDLQPRAPIVTVMGHVDHGKTSLLDYIRTATVAEGEAGGITQHIGAYEVQVNDKRITFLDTPGHEAFTAMRARGAKVTDIAIIIIAADDNIMPQTKEAISHAQAAGVPMVFAINKIDKPGAQPERIKQELANMNLLVEEWGGKYQSHDISAKMGTGIDELLEKVLLEAELQELQANPDREAIGTVLEASLDKGRGYVTKTLIQTGTLEIGDPIVAGEHSGKVKAMFNEHGKRVKKVGPSRPVLILGLGGAPQAGERFKVVESEQEARSIASKRGQIMREQANRATKRISLDEIGRRLALGNFKELNLIVKGDVDGSIEALSDALIKQSIESVQVNVIHKAVGQIIESDVLLASASDAIIIGFQVRPSLGARKLAEREGIEIKMYSIIYEAIEEVRAAIEGMLEPTKEERILGNVEVRETYKISKVGTIAGCYVQEGKILRNSNVRVVRDGIVVYPTKEGVTGKIASLKRFKEDVREVKSGLECGLNVENYNDIKVGDIIEAYEIVEVKQTLD